MEKEPYHHSAIQTKELVRELEEKFGDKTHEVEETIEETTMSEEQLLFVISLQIKLSKM